MQIDGFDTQDKVFVIAEIGNNHEGDLTLAEELIGRAAESGADAVKFQTFVTEHYVSPVQEARFEMLKRFEFTPEEFSHLKGVADREGITFFSTPFDLKSLEFLGGLCSVIKISSGDNTFYPLIKSAAATGLPLILSSGMAGLGLLGYAKSLAERVWTEKGLPGEMAVLHCVTSYPVPPAEANLSAIGALKALGCEVGYSDHTLGIEASVLSVAAGARIVEKHFTVDHDYSDFRDHKISADPGELKCMVERIREVEELLGSGVKDVFDCERDNQGLMRRSLAASRDMSKGDVVMPEDITWVRPAAAFAPGQEFEIVGCRMTRDLAAGHAFDPENIDGDPA